MAPAFQDSSRQCKKILWHFVVVVDDVISDFQWRGGLRRRTSFEIGRKKLKNTDKVASSFKNSNFGHFCCLRSGNFLSNWTCIKFPKFQVRLKSAILQSISSGIAPTMATENESHSNFEFWCIFIINRKYITLPKMHRTIGRVNDP
jgi:hypothetical protein